MGWLSNISISLSGGNASLAGGYTVRTVIPAAIMQNFGGSKIRITVNGGTAASYVVDKMYIGIKADTGDAYDFASAPTEILFSGGHGFTVTAGNTLVSDATTFTIPTGKGIVISQYSTPNTNTIKTTSLPAGSDAYYIGADDTTTVNTSGYAANGFIWGISLVESFFVDSFGAMWFM